MFGAEPFLAAIRAEPLAETPRLVYADWLDDQGDPWLALEASLRRASKIPVGTEYVPEHRLRTLNNDVYTYHGRPQCNAAGWVDGDHVDAIMRGEARRFRNVLVYNEHANRRVPESVIYWLADLHVTTCWSVHDKTCMSFAFAPVLRITAEHLAT